MFTHVYIPDRNRNKLRPSMPRSPCCAFLKVYFQGYAYIAVCKVGYEGTPGSCVACSVGSYRSTLNMRSCESCPGDKSTNGTGADSPDKCGKFIRHTFITRMFKATRGGLNANFYISCCRGPSGKCSFIQNFRISQ